MQGLRHAATLLLTNRLRSISADGSCDSTTFALKQLADELVALAQDMRAPADAAVSLAEAFDNAVDRLPQRFDAAGAKAYARVALARIRESGPAPIEQRDLFLIYVPADRLPVAAPLAIELTKRRVTVAFSEYEVATGDDLTRALARGLDQHQGGVLLHTPAFDRAGLSPPEESPRLKLASDASESTCLALLAWVRHFRSAAKLH